MSAFFQETCKILGIHKVNTTSYHPSGNGMIERLYRTLHTGLSHFVKSANNNLNVLVPFFLMAYRATPNTTTKYSPFYLLHGRETPLPTNENLKAKISKENPSHSQRLENLKASKVSLHISKRSKQPISSKQQGVQCSQSQISKI